MPPAEMQQNTVRREGQIPGQERISWFREEGGLFRSQPGVRPPKLLPDLRLRLTCLPRI